MSEFIDLAAITFAQGGIGGFSLAEAAEYMLPEACYRYGLQKRKAGEGNEAAVSLKIAAAKEYLPAISFLAEELYEQIAMEVYAGQGEETRKNKILNCLALFQYLLRREPQENVRERKEKVGFLYSWLGDVQRAFGHVVGGRNCRGVVPMRLPVSERGRVDCRESHCCCTVFHGGGKSGT